MRFRLVRTLAVVGLTFLAACAGADPSSTPTATPLSIPASAPTPTGSDPSDLLATTVLASPGEVDMFFDDPRYL